MADIGQQFSKLTLLTRAGAVAGAALTLAACQTAPGYDAEGNPTTGALAKPNFPIQTETATPRAPPPPKPAPLPVPAPAAKASPPPSSSPVFTPQVETKSLAPPTSVAVAPQTPPPVVASKPVANPPAALAAPPRQSTAAVSAYVVKPGQGVDAVARETNTTRQALIDLNDLKAPYALEVGQTLKVPGSSSSSPSPAAGKAYEVAAGDTLFSIAKRFGLQPAELAETNGFVAGAPIRPGQRLNLPRNAADQGASPTAQGVLVAAVAPAMRPTIAPAPPPSEAIRTVVPPPAPIAAQPEYLPTPPAKRDEPPVLVARANPAPPPAQVLNVPVVPRPAATVVNASSAQIKAAGSGKFIWPVKGRVLNDFGPKSDGQRNDGINIAAPMNASVHAAADGEVIYAGDQLREYGNLVLIRHADGFVTAYGFLAKVNVKMKDKVSQNQEIGEVGQGANSGQPQLYFETRYARTPADSPAPPVDPMLVLPTP